MCVRPLCSPEIFHVWNPETTESISAARCGRMRGIMENKITDETIDYVALLAKLELSAEEKERAKKDMSDMLSYIDKLNELDTMGIEPMSHVFPVQNVFREDVVTGKDEHSAMLANAPAAKEGMFKVPRTVE